MRCFLRGIWLFVSIILFVGCGEMNVNDIDLDVESYSDPDVLIDEDKSDVDMEEKPAIILSKESLELLDDKKGSVSFRIDPVLETSWEVSNIPDWLKVVPSSGIISDKSVEIVFSAEIKDLDVGEYSEVLKISAKGAGEAALDVKLNVLSHPLIQVSPDLIEFSSKETEKKITVTNVGRGALNWEINSLPEWLSVDIDNGTILENDSREITASVNRDGLPVGSEISELEFTSNSENGKKTVSVSVDVPENYSLKVVPEDLEFKYFETEKSITLFNKGNITVAWEIESSADYIGLQPLSGELDVGASVNIVVSLDMMGKSTGIFVESLKIKNNIEEESVIPLKKHYYNDDKLYIEGNVVDAEYDRNNDAIIIVAESPERLIKIETSGMEVSEITLAHSPQNISISPEGDLAVVGHDKCLSYIDLDQMSVKQVFPLSVDVFDVVLASNGWAYASPMTGQWVDLVNINLSSGDEEMSSGMFRQRTKMVLHPSGSCIYGARTESTPTDFEKYDITGGKALYLYDSQYHGDYNFGKNIWISDDGALLFGKGRTAFNYSEKESEDIIYYDSLEGTGNIVAFDHSTKAGRVYAVLSTDTSWDEVPENEVRKYNAETLALISVEKLPDFLIPDGNGDGEFSESMGFFGFFNSEGTKFFVIQKAPDYVNLDNKWAVVELIVK